jgi:hypothetical protein
MIIGSATALFSCKKHNDSAPMVCRIVAEYDTLYGGTAAGGSTMGTVSYQLEYDYKGRLIHFSTMALSADTFGRVWTYGSGYAYAYPGSYRSSTDTIYTDDSNRVTKLISVEPNNYVTTTVYSYDAAGQLVTKTQTTNQSNDQYITNYSWSDGDMISEKNNSGNFTTHSYYMDKLATDGDVNRHHEITSYGVPIVRSKHLLKSTGFGVGMVNYNYTFDKSGRIATVSTASGAYFAKMAYVYDCSQ